MRKNYKAMVAEYNQVLPLLDYFKPMVGNKKQVKILDVGSGPLPKTGQYLEGVEIEIVHCDNQDFTPFWAEAGEPQLSAVEYQDMEKLTYPPGTFDIVHCANALDHTRDAHAALKEMLRVVKPGGWVYIDCALDQLSSQGKKHYWDAKEDGSFTNGNDSFSLKAYGFDIEYIDNGGERQYNHIIARQQC